MRLNNRTNVSLGCRGPKCFSLAAIPMTSVNPSFAEASAGISVSSAYSVANLFLLIHEAQQGC